MDLARASAHLLAHAADDVTTVTSTHHPPLARLSLPLPLVLLPRVCSLRHGFNPTQTLEAAIACATYTISPISYIALGRRKKGKKIEFAFVLPRCLSIFCKYSNLHKYGHKMIISQNYSFYVYSYGRMNLYPLIVSIIRGYRNVHLKKI